MTDVVMLGERKGNAKWEPCMLLSAILKMSLLGKECGEILKIYYWYGQNAAQTSSLPQKPWITARPMHLMYVKAVLHLIYKFKATDCTCDWPWLGRPSAPVETVAEVHQAICTVRSASSHGVLRILYIPNSTVRKILCSAQNMFPFWFQHVQMLEAGDNQLRLDFANKFLIRYDEDSSWPLCILWTDEAHFTVTGNVNSKKCVHWADNNPHDVFASPLHHEQVTVWCGITSMFIFGLYFLKRLLTAICKRV